MDTTATAKGKVRPYLCLAKTTTSFCQAQHSLADRTPGESVVHANAALSWPDISPFEEMVTVGLHLHLGGVPNR